MNKPGWLLAILLLGAILRLYGLGERSLSYDECQQFWASRGNVLVSNREITLDPPGFASLLNLHARVSLGETWLRLLPCLFGILGILAVHALAWAVTGNGRTALAAAFFFALAPYPIRYSQSLRVYSLAMLLSATLVFVFLRALEADDRPRPHGRLFLLAMLACGALLATYGAVWLVLTMIGILLFGAWRGKIAPALRIGSALVAGAALAAPFYLLSLPTQMSQGTPAAFYEDKFLPTTGFIAAIRFLAKGTLDLLSYLSFIHPAAGAGFGALALFGMTRLSRQPAGRRLVALLLGCLGAAAAASALRLFPYGGTRQMLFAAPLFAVCVAAGIESLRGWARGSLSAAALVATACGGTIFLHRYHREPAGQEMRPVIRYLEREMRPGDGILVNKDAIPQFRFYYHGDPRAVVWGRETVIREYLPEINRILPERARARWWLVFSHGWRAARRAELTGVDARFAAAQRFEAHQAAAYLFVRREDSATDSPSVRSP